MKMLVGGELWKHLKLCGLCCVHMVNQSDEMQTCAFYLQPLIEAEPLRAPSIAQHENAE